MARRKISDAQKRIAERRVARKLALFAIYQWQMTQHSLQEIYIQLQHSDNYAADFRKADAAFLYSLIKYAITHAEEIEALIQPYLEHRNLKQVDMIEQAVLRMATCELLNHLETPYKVVVSEAVNISKKFGAEQGYKFVNGVMTQLINQLRSAENPTQREKKPKVKTSPTAPKKSAKSIITTTKKKPTKIKTCSTLTINSFKNTTNSTTNS